MEVQKNFEQLLLAVKIFFALAGWENLLGASLGTKYQPMEKITRQAQANLKSPHISSNDSLGQRPLKFEIHFKPPPLAVIGAKTRL